MQTMNGYMQLISYPLSRMATYHVRNEEELEEQLPSAAIGDTIIIAHRNGPKKKLKQ